MKKVVSLLIVVCLCFSLSACGESTEVTVEKENTEETSLERKDTAIEICRQNVVKIGEAYLTGEITADEAETQLEEIEVPDALQASEIDINILKADIAMLQCSITITSMYSPDEDGYADAYEELEKTIDSIRNR